MSTGPDDPFAAEEWFKFTEDFLANCAPKIMDSAVTMHFAQEPDPRSAIQLGYSIMLGKPIVTVVTPGQEIPEKMRLISDVIVEMNLNDPEQTARRIEDAMIRLGLM